MGLKGVHLKRGDGLRDREMRVGLRACGPGEDGNG